MTPSRHARSRRLLLVPMLLAFFLLAALAAPATASAAGPPTTQVPTSYILVDADRGTVLLAKGEHDPHYTASTIKVLTALVTIEHLPPSATLHVSRLAAAQPASKIDMKEGSVWTLDQALHSLMIISANDAAYAMAENTGCDLANFATMANATGRRLGLQNTAFHDPAGLDGAQGFQGGTTSSAYDLAIVARNALAVPAIAGPASLVRYEFTDPTGAGRRLLNHNRGFLTSYPGAIGLKTGFTKLASRTLITAARRDGRTLIAVVMGTWDDTGWASYLLDQGFAGVDGGPTPAQVPPVRVRPFDGRPGTGRATCPTAVLGATAVKAKGPHGKAGHAISTPKSPAVVSAGDASVTPTAPIANSDGGTTLTSVLKGVGIAFGVLLVGVVLLRRRAVKRQRARRIERLRAHREARRRGMIDIVEPDDAETDVRVVPVRTSHHVAASAKRHPADRQVLRPSRPRDHTGTPQDRTR